MLKIIRKLKKIPIIKIDYIEMYKGIFSSKLIFLLLFIHFLFANSSLPFFMCVIGLWLFALANIYNFWSFLTSRGSVPGANWPSSLAALFLYKKLWFINRETPSGWGSTPFYC